MGAKQHLLTCWRRLGNTVATPIGLFKAALNRDDPRRTLRVSTGVVGQRRVAAKDQSVHRRVRYSQNAQR